MKVLAGSMNASSKVKQAQGSALKLSKVCTLGKTHRLFFRTTVNEDGERDLIVAAVPGRNADYEYVGTSFIPLSDFDQTDEGKIIDKSGLQPLANISSIIFEAQYTNAVESAKEEAQSIADKMQQAVDIVSLQRKLDEIEIEFRGKKEVGKQEIFPTKRKAISGVVLSVATEVLVVPLAVDGTPEFADARTATVDIGSRKEKQLKQLLKHKDYYNGTDDFLEVDFAYIGKDTKEAGANATLQGVAEALALKTRFPELVAANLDKFETVPQNAQAIASRNRSMSSSVSAAQIQEAFKKSAMKEVLVLTRIDFDSDVMKYAAKDLLDSGITSNVKLINDNLIAYVEAQNKDKIEDASETDSAITADVANAAKEVKSLAELANAVGEGDLDTYTGNIEQI